MEAYATNFDEYVRWMATNSPHATVLDWWRRLDRAVHDHAPTTRRTPSRGSNTWSALQTAIVNDRRLGQGGATMLQRLRDLRNRVAHEPGVSVSPEQATDYARQALSLIGALAVRPSAAFGVEDDAMLHRFIVQSGDPT